MMKVLRTYEAVTGIMTYLNKILVYLHEKVHIGICNQIKRITGSLLFTFLGCPILYGRKNRKHFEELINKVMKRINLWQNRLLSFGGMCIYINSSCSTMSSYVHALSCLC